MALGNYNLDKSSKKYQCPSCGMKTFVRFVDKDLNLHQDLNFGRCDRESKCRYFRSANSAKKYYWVQFLELRSISKRAFRLVDIYGNIEILPKSEITKIDEEKCLVAEWILIKRNILYCKQDAVFQSDSNLTDCVRDFVIEKDRMEFDFHLYSELENERQKFVRHNFLNFLTSIFEKHDVDVALERYLITGTDRFWKHSTIFWQVDRQNRVHAGKIMLYETTTGKRVKKPFNCINWFHKSQSLKNFKLGQCIFGLHLVKDDARKICIVESEKTAVFASIILPEYYWLATGAKHNLKELFLNPIKNSAITLFPDKGCYKDWKQKAEILIEKGFNITISDFIEKSFLEDGEDIADLFLSDQ